METAVSEDLGKAPITGVRTGSRQTARAAAAQATAGGAREPEGRPGRLAHKGGQRWRGWRRGAPSTAVLTGDDRQLTFKPGGIWNGAFEGLGGRQQGQFNSHF